MFLNGLKKLRRPPLKQPRPYQNCSRPDSKQLRPYCYRRRLKTTVRQGKKLACAASPPTVGHAAGRHARYSGCRRGPGPGPGRARQIKLPVIISEGACDRVSRSARRHPVRGRRYSSKRGVPKASPRRQRAGTLPYRSRSLPLRRARNTSKRFGLPGASCSGSVIF